MRLLPLRKRLTRWQYERRMVRAAKRIARRGIWLDYDQRSMRFKVLGRWVGERVFEAHGA
jgi:hypothetical protein